MVHDIEQCQFKAEQRWAKIDLDLQKIKDDMNNINKRLDKIDALTQQMQEMTLTTNTLALNMQSTLKEIENLRKDHIADKKSLEKDVQKLDTKVTDDSHRIDELERKPGKRWESVIGYITSAIVVVLIGFIAVKLGLS